MRHPSELTSCFGMTNVAVVVVVSAILLRIMISSGCKSRHARSTVRYECNSPLLLQVERIAFVNGFTCRLLFEIYMIMSRVCVCVHRDS